MNVVIRPALPEDAKAITRIAKATFGHDFDCERVRQILQAKGNYTFVAERAETILGYADSFVSRSSLGSLRCELDLLAVDKSARGLGIGAQLARQSTHLAVALDADLARTLVRTENFVMRDLMRRCGFKQSLEVFRLFVNDRVAQVCPLAPCHSGHLIKVDTLSYSGIWIEGRISTEVIEAAIAQAIVEDLQTIGAVVSSSDTVAQSSLAACGFSDIGAYHWWTLNLKSDQS